MPIENAVQVSPRAAGGGAGEEAGAGLLRIAALSSFTIQPMAQFLTEALRKHGFQTEVYVGQYGQIAEEVFSENSGLYQGRPDTVALIPAAEDWLAPLYQEPWAFSLEAARNLVTERLNVLRSSLTTLLARLPASACYVVAFAADWAPAGHVLAPDAPERGQLAVQQWLDGVRSLGSLSPAVVIVDWEWQVRAQGQAQYRDERLFYLASMRLNPAGLFALSDLLASHIAAYRGPARKVAVVDLDNTLWGGVVDESGTAGLTLGEEGIGLAFLDFQRELLKLRSLGVVLAICSKNDPEYVWDVFETHRAMLLKREHFSAARINWHDKAANLQELAFELKLGADSFVFLDDNPVERARVREALPEVFVPELPADPTERPRFLRQLTCFQRIRTTEADLRRAEAYDSQRERSELRSTVSSIDEFLASLHQEAEILPVDDGSIARAAQMCQRTNQFNLTTRRYTIAELGLLLRDPCTELYTCAVKDRLGDSGITGLAILRFSEQSAVIDTLLLSCRVLGRQIEDVFLSFLADRARRRGAQNLVGEYISTPKNKLASDFYRSRGFTPMRDGVFQMKLERTCLPKPATVLLKENVR